MEEIFLIVDYCAYLGNSEDMYGSVEVKKFKNIYKMNICIL